MKIVRVKQIRIGMRGIFVDLNCNPNTVWYFVPGATNYHKGSGKVVKEKRHLYFAGQYDIESCFEAIKAAPPIDAVLRLEWEEAPIIASPDYLRRCKALKNRKPKPPRRKKASALRIETSVTSLPGGKR